MKFHDKAQNAANLILQTFQHSQDLPAALAPMFIQRNDPKPCRQWSWCNQMLVALAGTSDARGIRQWNAVGRRVKAGSKCFHILAPITIKKTVKTDSGEEADSFAVIGFKSVPVFRAEDTDGEPIPDNSAEQRQWIESLPLIEVAQSWGIMVDTYSGEKAHMMGFFQSSSLGAQSISLGVKNLSTWCHELTHAADHKLVGLKGGQHADQEIVAELGASILLKVLGFDSDADLRGCFDYCKGYAEKEGKSLVSVCMKLIDRTCNAVELILNTADEARAAAQNLQGVA